MIIRIFVFCFALTTVNCTEYYDDKFPKYTPTKTFYPTTTIYENMRLTVTKAYPYFPWTKDSFGKDFMTFKDKELVCIMIKELLLDAHNKRLQATKVRNFHRAAMAFEVGQILGTIRENYRRMLEIYREVTTQEARYGYKPLSTVWPIWFHKDQLRPIYYFSIYEFIREQQWGITKLVELLQDIPVERMHMKPSTILPYSESTTTQTTTTGVDNSTAEGETKTSDPSEHEYPYYSGESVGGGNRRAQDKDSMYKSRLREKFLLRWMGLNDSLSTTKKRFHKGWPVEETWDNLKYD